MKITVNARLGLLAVVGMLATALSCADAQQDIEGGVAIDADDIGGVVGGPNGPEAGVWVIAETMDLPTKFNRIVVTDDQGRYLLPDLPDATYDVWVRGYGLVDSPKTPVTPGTTQNLTAVPAPNEAAAAAYYPAGYWLSLIQVPDKDEFPGTGPRGNGISPNMVSQADWIRNVKGGCTGCHALGNKATREIPTELGEFDSLVAAWDRRIQSGQAGGSMITGLTRLGRQRALEMFADWTDRILTGELPPEAPPRPQGAERNVVITQWDWADPKVYLHDEISTDKRNPTVNANGPIYGALEASADYVPVLDPVRHTASQVRVPVRDPATPRAAGRASGGSDTPLQPSPYWGDEVLWDSQADAHNPMLDHEGRVWLTSRVRPLENPAFCREGSDHLSAKLFPVASASRHLAVYDPTTEEFRLISTCFSTHHLVFAEDDDNTLWTSGGGGGNPVVGWLNTKMFDETGDEEQSQGWTALILDTNGNGTRDAYVEPDEPVDPTKDKRIIKGYYGVAVSPVDGSIWGTSLGFPG